ncbi:hypothetical protein [Streptococcus sp. 959]|jgi:hypothetical protein|uniref:hypothetical protein n=1 Tax=Streptococcus sp. 959 TaxID=2582655 RepID=UPI001566C510|nr:hypothetical protein [Streptococcus sp. 959]
MALSKQNIKQQGNKIAKLLPHIEIIQQLSKALLLADNSGADSKVLHHQMKQAFSVIFEMADQAYQEIDQIACKLINCDDKELEVKPNGKRTLYRNSYDGRRDKKR